VRAFAQSIVETVRHPLLVLHSDLRIATANDRFLAMFGMAGPRFPTLSFAEIPFLGKSAPVLQSLHDLVATNRPIESLEWGMDGPLGPRTLLVSARRVAHDDGLAMVLVALEDVTESRRASIELHRLNHELEKRVSDRTAQLQTANRELESFCYSVSHDLRAPLRAIDGFSGELLRNYSEVLDDRGRHYLARVRIATQRMGQLIDDLLELSRINRGEIRRAPVDLSRLARELIHELQMADASRKVEIDIAPNLAAIGDESLLRIALANLLGNAWKFTSKKPQAAISMGQIETAQGPAFFIRDDGAGFDMAHAAKMFGAFQRLHASHEFPGTGIGLATVQRVILRHQGRVWAESTPDQGATFYFTIPQAETP